MFTIAGLHSLLLTNRIPAILYPDCMIFVVKLQKKNIRFNVHILSFCSPAAADRTMIASQMVLVLSLSTSPKRRIKMAAARMARKPMTRKAAVARAKSAVNTKNKCCK